MSVVYVAPDGTPMKMGVEAVLFEIIEIDAEHGHWLWTGNLTPRKKGKGGAEIDSGGYGRCNMAAVMSAAVDAELCKRGAGGILVHRYTYWCFHGFIPRDAQGRTAVIDHDQHKCDGRPHNCCNPNHLTAVTSELNTNRGGYARTYTANGQLPLLDVTPYEIGVLQP